MPRNKIRHRIGFWVGEIATAIVLSLGFLVFLLLAVNGFSFESTVLFLDNFTGRFVTASPDLTSAFGLRIKLITIFIAAVILTVRFVDRLSKREANA